MYKLIRDKLPELAKEQGKIIEYATASTDGLYINLLRSKLVEGVQEFLTTNDIVSLLDVQEVIDTIVKVAGVEAEEFDKMVAERAEHDGTFEGRTIAFLPDQVQETKPADTPEK